MKLNRRGQKGITLVALVVTIIILIILAGISINLVLGDNGIITKTKQGKEDYIKAQLKEELELKIAEIEMKKIEQGRELTREDLLDLREQGAAIENAGDISIGEYKDYEIIIDEEFQVIIGEKLTGEKPVIQLTKTPDTEEVVEKITINVEATMEDGNIELIRKPDGTTTNETSFNYEVTENKSYTFVAKGSNGRYGFATIEINNLKETIIEPIIQPSNIYPTVSENGIELKGSISITFDKKDSIENYYSLDNGATWKKYTGPISTQVEGPIIAKSVSKKSGIEVTARSESILGQDALPYACYDKEIATCAVSGGRLLVEPSVWGKEISFFHDGWYQRHGMNICCYDENEAQLYNASFTGDANVHEEKIQIPEGTVKIAVGNLVPTWANMLYEVYLPKDSPAELLRNGTDVSGLGGKWQKTMNIGETYEVSKEAECLVLSAEINNRVWVGYSYPLYIEKYSTMVIDYEGIGEACLYNVTYPIPGSFTWPPPLNSENRTQVSIDISSLEKCNLNFTTTNGTLRIYNVYFTK